MFIILGKMTGKELFNSMPLLSYFCAIIKLLALQKSLQVFVKYIIVNVHERFYEVFLKELEGFNVRPSKGFEPFKSAIKWTKTAFPIDCIFKFIFNFIYILSG